MRYNEVITNPKSRGLLPSRCACHLPHGGRLFVSPIITQIGRENKFSADISCLHFSVKNNRKSVLLFFWVTRTGSCPSGNIPRLAAGERAPRRLQAGIRTHIQNASVLSGANWVQGNKKNVVRESVFRFAKLVVRRAHQQKREEHFCALLFFW